VSAPKGPWTVQDLGPARGDLYPEWRTFAVRSAENICLAVVGNVDRYHEDKYEATARLMAASPDLLAALRRFLRATDEVDQVGARMNARALLSRLDLE
jgi:hypothetical protein